MSWCRGAEECWPQGWGMQARPDSSKRAAVRAPCAAMGNQLEICKLTAVSALLHISILRKTR